MKYSLMLLVSAASLISVNGKLPEYIHTCKSNDPQITPCIKSSILSLRPRLISGIPELSVPPIDPIHLDKFALNLGPGFKAEARDLVVKGAKNFKIHDLDVDIDANTYSFTVSVPDVTVTGIYEVDAAIASIPLKGQGPLHVTAKSVSGRGTLHGKKVVRGGKTYYWFPTMKMKVQIGDYNIKLDNLFEGQPAIAEVTNKLLNEEKTEIMASLLPEFEKSLIHHFLLTANNICKHFTWDELFPES